MKISVVIPVYNVELYLSQCLDTVITQDYQDLEIICVDDCSTDNSYEILKDYQKKDSRIKVLQNKINIGVGLSRNKGFDESTGEYIHFLDPDDWLENSAYSRLVDRINKLENLPDVLLFNYKRFDNNEKTFEQVFFEDNVIFDKILNPIKDACVYHGWERYAWLKLHKRSFLIEYNICYNDYPAMEDVEQAAQVFVKAGSICFVNEYIVNYRTKREGSLVLTATANLKWIIKSFENNKKLYKNLPRKLKYSLLGWDFFLVRYHVFDGYFSNQLSLYEFIKFLLRHNTPDKFFYYSKFKLHKHDKHLFINPIKIIWKKHFPYSYKSIISFKKKLLGIKE